MLPKNTVFFRTKILISLLYERMCESWQTTECSNAESVPGQSQVDTVVIGYLDALQYKCFLRNNIFGNVDERKTTCITRSSVNPALIVARTLHKPSASSCFTLSCLALSCKVFPAACPISRYPDLLPARKATAGWCCTRVIGVGWWLLLVATRGRPSGLAASSLDDREKRGKTYSIFKCAFCVASRSAEWNYRAPCEVPHATYANFTLLSHTQAGCPQRASWLLPSQGIEPPRFLVCFRLLTPTWLGYLRLPRFENANGAHVRRSGRRTEAPSLYKRQAG